MLVATQKAERRSASVFQRRLEMQFGDQRRLLDRETLRCRCITSWIFGKRAQPVTPAASNHMPGERRARQSAGAAGVRWRSRHDHGRLHRVNGSAVGISDANPTGEGHSSSVPSPPFLSRGDDEKSRRHLEARRASERAEATSKRRTCAHGPRCPAGALSRDPGRSASHSKWPGDGAELA